MKVKELIELLEKEDGERTVILQKDSEGNGYSPLSNVWTGAYAPDSTWSGEAGLEELTEEDKKDGYDEEDIVDGEKALILSPTN